jgi:hypothetical protein
VEGKFYEALYSLSIFFGWGPLIQIFGWIPLIQMLLELLHFGHRLLKKQFLQIEGKYRKAPKDRDRREGAGELIEANS